MCRVRLFSVIHVWIFINLLLWIQATDNIKSNIGHRLDAKKEKCVSDCQENNSATIRSLDKSFAISTTNKTESEVEDLDFILNDASSVTYKSENKLTEITTASYSEQTKETSEGEIQTVTKEEFDDPGSSRKL